MQLGLWNFLVEIHCIAIGRKPVFFSVKQVYFYLYLLNAKPPFPIQKNCVISRTSNALPKSFRYVIGIELGYLLICYELVCLPDSSNSLAIS